MRIGSRVTPPDEACASAAHCSGCRPTSLRDASSVYCCPLARASSEAFTSPPVRKLLVVREHSQHQRRHEGQQGHGIALHTIPRAGLGTGVQRGCSPHAAPLCRRLLLDGCIPLRLRTSIQDHGRTLWHFHVMMINSPDLHQTKPINDGEKEPAGCCTYPAGLELETGRRQQLGNTVGVWRGRFLWLFYRVTVGNDDGLHFMIISCQ